MNSSKDLTHRFATLVALCCWLLPIASAIGQTSTKDPSAQIETTDQGKVLVVRGIAAPGDFELQVRRAAGASASESDEAGSIDANPSLPPILGTTRVEPGRLIFVPRFPLLPGKYRVTVRPLVERSNVAALQLNCELVAPVTEPTFVQAVFPSAAELPENTLKFYVYFSSAMRKGDIYRFIELKEVGGEVVEHPFLEIEQEFWSRDASRLTLLLDPGRVKQGLAPRDSQGPVLAAGKSYQLTIQSTWPDANGKMLKRSFVKEFRAIAADTQQPDPRQWEVSVPALVQEGRTGGSKTSFGELKILFPKPLDYAMLQNSINVIDAQGRTLAGLVAVGDGEREWRFKAAGGWQPGRFKITIDSALEDNCGNSIGRKFDVDLFERTQPVAAEPVKLEFEIPPLSNQAR